MRHFFYLTVKGPGYGLYAREPGQEFRRQPRDQASEAVPAGYRFAHKRLDRLFEDRQERWSVSFQRVDADARPVLAYGGKVAAAEEEGRPGIIFIHAVELDADELYPCAAAVLTLLEPAAARRLKHEVASLAVGKADVSLQEFLQRTADSLEAELQKCSASVALLPTPGDMAAVEHDRLGGAAVAWLTMAALRSRAPGPWEVFEQLVDRQGRIETRTLPSEGRAVPAAQLVLQIASAGEPSGNGTSPPGELVPSAPPVAPAVVGNRWPSRGPLVVAAGVALGLVAFLLGTVLGGPGQRAGKADGNRVEELEKTGRLQEQRLVELGRKYDARTVESTERKKEVANLLAVVALREAEYRKKAAYQQAEAEWRVANLRKLGKENEKRWNDNLAQERDGFITREDESRKQNERNTNALMSEHKRELATAKHEREIMKQKRDDATHLVAIMCARVEDLKDRITRLEKQRDDTQKLQQALSELKNPSIVAQMAFCPDGKNLAIASWDRMVRLRSIADDRELLLQESWAQQIRCLAFLPDHNVLAAAAYLPGAPGKKGTIRLRRWDVKAKKELPSLEAHSHKVTAAAISADGKLAIASEDGTVRVVRDWKKATADVVGKHDAVSALAISPDGKRLASGCDKGTVRLWDVATAREMPLPRRASGSRITCIAFHSGGNQVAVGSKNGSIEVWDVKRKSHFTFRAHEGPVQSVALSKDGRWLASAGDPGIVLLWDASRKGDWVWRGEHAEQVWCVAFSPDGRLASGGSDKKIRLWSTPARR